MTGVVIRALSGFYYVFSGDVLYECRPKGAFRREGISPLVGDRVEFNGTGGDKGVIRQILPRQNFFIRPAVANVELMIIVASTTDPVTDPFLVDRITVTAIHHDCRPLICINKSDLASAGTLAEIYCATGFPVVVTSAETGEGVNELRRAINEKVCAITGNSGVGKSSLLNRLDPQLRIKVGETSKKLGRGRHTTRHVELYPVGNDSYIADTPGFSTFDIEQIENLSPTDLQWCFPEFEEYIGSCRFSDCMHDAEPGCAVIEAMERGGIHRVRHSSYLRMLETLQQKPEWERRQMTDDR